MMMMMIVLVLVLVLGWMVIDGGMIVRVDESALDLDRSTLFSHPSSGGSEDVDESFDAAIGAEDLPDPGGGRGEIGEMSEGREEWQGGGGIDGSSIVECRSDGD